LTRAIEEYNNGVASSVLTTNYGIPGSTIRNHKSNPKLRIGAGRPTLLSNEHEKYFVELLKNLENIGFRLTKPIVLQLSSDYVQRVNGKDIEVGRKWLKNFLQRWQHELKVVKEEKMESARRNGFTENIRSGWFENLKQILQNNNLITRPHAIFNCDESGFSDETACEMVIVSHETKHVYEQSGGTGKSFTTNLVCGNAGGEILPPFIIYSAKKLNPDWTFGGPPGSFYGVSESGWITKKLFFEWFKLFVEHTKNASKPVLLIMDNHPCHISIEVIEMAKQYQVLLLLLPPHSTHALQPLDFVTFSAAKSSWTRIVGKYFSKSHRKTIRKRDLPSLFNQLYTSAFTPKQVIGGFTRTGIWPYDPTVMKHKVARQPLMKQLDQSSSTINSTNISTSSTQTFVTLIDTNCPIASSILPSSDLHDQDTSLMVLNFLDNFIDEANRISNENTSPGIATKPTAAADNSSFTTNLSSSLLSNEATDVFQPLPTNSNFNISHRSFSSDYDVPQFLSSTSNFNLCENSSNRFDFSIDKSNTITSSVDTNSTFKQLHQSSEWISHGCMREHGMDEVDDGQKIIGFNPYTLSTTHINNSNYSNNRLQQQLVSVIDFEQDSGKENRPYIDATPFGLSILTAPPEVLHIDQFNINRQNTNSMPSSQLSPSTAVRSIVNDIFRQRTFHSSSPSITNKRKRIEGIYGEEITSSNMLNELKKKASQPNPAKRIKKSNKQMTTASISSDGIDIAITNKPTRKLAKRTNEIITLSQATRAISTFQTSTLAVLTSD
ncbi:unnamed protein product, partial [Rotaria sordida]